MEKIGFSKSLKDLTLAAKLQGSRKSDCPTGPLDTATEQRIASRQNRLAPDRVWISASAFAPLRRYGRPIAPIKPSDDRKTGYQFLESSVPYLLPECVRTTVSLNLPSACKLEQSIEQEHFCGRRSCLWKHTDCAQQDQRFRNLNRFGITQRWVASKLPQTLSSIPGKLKPFPETLQPTCLSAMAMTGMAGPEGFHPVIAGLA